jgi:ribosomal subunit interface protein
MSFPIISFKHSNTPVSYHLQELVAQKFQSLAHHVEGNTTAGCEVEFEKVAPHNNGPVYRVETNIWFDGDLYRAENVADSFEKAIDAVRAEIDREMRRARSKKQSLWRKGARKIKNLMRFGKEL